MKIQSSLQTSGEGVSRLEKCPHDAHAQQTITHKQLRSSDKLHGNHEGRDSTGAASRQPKLARPAGDVAGEPFDRWRRLSVGGSVGGRSAGPGRSAGASEAGEEWGRGEDERERRGEGIGGDGIGGGPSEAGEEWAWGEDEREEDRRCEGVGGDGIRGKAGEEGGRGEDEREASSRRGEDGGEREGGVLKWGWGEDEREESSRRGESGREREGGVMEAMKVLTGEEGPVTKVCKRLGESGGSQSAGGIGERRGVLVAQLAEVALGESREEAAEVAALGEARGCLRIFLLLGSEKPLVSWRGRSAAFSFRSCFSCCHSARSFSVPLSLRAFRRGLAELSRGLRTPTSAAPRTLLHRLGVRLARRDASGAAGDAFCGLL